MQFGINFLNLIFIGEEGDDDRVIFGLKNQPHKLQWQLMSRVLVISSAFERKKKEIIKKLLSCILNYREMHPQIFFLLLSKFLYLGVVVFSLVELIRAGS